jgi:pyruvate/2-oxoglutarate dehydrogenase complex dihydrolipoamide dehydrogenase (E3) component
MHSYRRGKFDRRRTPLCRRRSTAYNLYTDPPLGRIGLTEAEARLGSVSADG